MTCSNSSPQERPITLLRKVGVDIPFPREVLDANGESFLIPYLDGFLFYVPQSGVLALLNIGGAEIMRRYYRKESLSADELEIPQQLSSIGELRPSRLRSVTVPASKRWKPCSVTFSTTQKCTLRCTYCYAEGGRLDDLDIPWDVAKAAIDLVIRNSIEERRNPTLNFLGEGEATAAWKEFRAAIDYFRSECARTGLEPYVSLSTNGVYSNGRTAYLAEKIDQLTFSLDGLAITHDANRVLPNGKGSFKIVVDNIRALGQAGKQCNIRATIGLGGLNQIDDFIRFVGEELTNCVHIHLEPVFDVTKVTNIKGTIAHPESTAFVEAFRRAKRVAAGFGIDVYYSASDLELRDSFCGATDGRNFLVTTRGIVTSCNEVLQPGDSRADIFHYGEWNKLDKAFTVDADRLDRLGQLRVGSMEKCQTCIAKYSCAGDCYARSSATHGTPWSENYTYRCDITRRLLVDNLVLALLKSKVLGKVVSESAQTCFV